MKKLLIVAVAGVLLAGCQNEARRFGYVGRDLEQELGDEEKLYFTDGSAITNWVPYRVMSVLEEYPFTEVEESVYRIFGSIQAGETLTKVPEGYVKRDVEPWFEVWTKDRTVFGEKGTLGFMAHCDPGAAKWETGDVFFSTYHKTRAEALEAMKRRRAGFKRECKPLRFHDFDQSFVAEFRRLRVITIVGLRSQDGSFACMTSVADKNRLGCGEWMPIADQQEMLEDFLYERAVNRWAASRRDVIAANHQAVGKAAGERALELFGDDGEPFAARGRDGFSAVWEKVVTLPAEDVGKEVDFGGTLASAAKNFGVAFGSVSSNGYSSAGYELSATGTNDLFSVNASMCVDGPDRAEDEDASATNGCRVVIRVDAVERLQPGFVIPPRPTRDSVRGRR